MARRPDVITRIHGMASRVASLLPLSRWTWFAVAALLLGTALLPLVARSLPERERIVIGNTAGMLTTMIETEGYRVLVGAGPTRSHAADLIGRTTRPWDREIDVLIVPGWDDSHAVGALGLLERRSVHGIAVLGVPGNDPVWTMLERHAREQDVGMRYLGSTHRLDLGPEIVMYLSGLTEDPGAWIRLDHHGTRLDLIDAEDVSTATPPATHVANRNEHVVINMRSQGVPELAEPRLLIRPMPFYPEDFQENPAEFVQELDRNQQVRIELAEGDLRLPMGGLSGLDS